MLAIPNVNPIGIVDVKIEIKDPAAIFVSSPLFAIRKRFVSAIIAVAKRSTSIGITIEKKLEAKSSSLST